MLLLLRLAGTLVRPLDKTAREPGSNCVTRWRVLPNDVDIFGHMNNSRYQAVMDLGRIDYLRQCDLLRGVLRNRWIVPVGSAHLEFRKALRPFERYELHTQLLHWDERWFYFRQQFFRRGDSTRAVCTGYVSTLFKGRQGAVPTEHVVRELAGRDLVAPPASDELVAIFRSEPAGRGAAISRGADCRGNCAAQGT